MKSKSNPLLRSLLTAVVSGLAATYAHAADVTITGSSAINGMNTNYTVNSPDALILDITGVGGSRATDTMGAAIAKSGGDLSIDGSGTLRVTGGSGDVLGVADVSGRVVNISLGSGGLIDIQGGAFVNGGWGGGNWSANLADMTIASGAVFDLWDGGAIPVDALTGAGSVQNGSNGSGVRSLVVGVDGGSGTFSGVIGGGTGRAGNNQISLTKQGMGTQILTGTNTYVGETTVSVGKLQIGVGGTSGNLGTGNVFIDSGATLEINRSDAYGTTGGQTFGGAGTLVKNGSGSLTFYGTGPNQGVVSGLQNLVINDGTVRTDSWAQWNSDLNLTVNGSGKFEMWNTTTMIGNLSGNGTVQNTANWSGYALGQPYATNNLTIAAGNFSGTITDNGIGNGGNTGTDGDTRMTLTKTGAGTLTLSGTNSYSGTTTVEAGTLAVVGSLPAASTVTVGSSGTLNPGTVGGTGVLTTGAATINGTLAIDINGAALDQLTVNGNLDLTGSTLAVNELATPTAGPHTVVTYTGTLGTTFASIPPGYTVNYGTGTNSSITLTKSTSDYNTWGAPYGLTTGSEGGDLDGDGVQNQAEYAFGLIPNSGASVNPITSQLNKTTGQFTYQRRDNGLTGLTYTIWYSTDLAAWTQDTGASQPDGTPDGNGVEAITATVSPALLTNPKLFLQVRAN